MLPLSLTETYTHVAVVARTNEYLFAPLTNVNTVDDLFVAHVSAYPLSCFCIPARQHGIGRSREEHSCIARPVHVQNRTLVAVEDADVFPFMRIPPEH